MKNISKSLWNACQSLFCCCVFLFQNIADKNKRYMGHRKNMDILDGYILQSVAK